MLVLSRRLHERLLIPSVQAAIEIIAIAPGQVRLGIEAPTHVKVFREEIYEPSTSQDSPSAEVRLAQLRHIVRNRLNNFTLGMALLRRHARAGSASALDDTLDRLEQELRVLSAQFQAALDDPDCLPEPLGTGPGGP